MRSTISDVEFNLHQLDNGNVIGVEYNKEESDFYMVFGKLEGLKKRITQLRISTEAAIMLQHLINKRLHDNNIVVTVSSGIESENITVVRTDIQKYTDA